MADVTHLIPSAEFGEVSLHVNEQGEGPPILLLHGGAGPASMSRFAVLLAETRQARVLAPIHPGFALTERPDNLRDIAGLARLYAALLENLELADVIVIGNSIGGWIAAELGLLGTPWVSRLVLIDAVGLDVRGHPVTDVAGMAVPEIMQLSFHDPAPFLRDPAALSGDERASLAANQAALAVYAPEMTDPTLAARLNGLRLPTLVLWGAGDGIVDAEYGRAYADAIDGAQFELLPDTGHMPQMESPESVIGSLARDLP
jgi:pimeloyl-ACP methyl ester carboxylesterase